MALDTIDNGDSYLSVRERVNLLSVGFDNAPVLNVKLPPYSATGNGSTDDTAAIQAALDDLDGVGGVVFLPVGVYYQTSALLVPEYVTVQGVGDKSVIVCNTDIEQIVSDRTSAVANTGITLRDFRVRDVRTLTDAVNRTKYQIRITNPVRLLMDNVDTSTGMADAEDYRENVAGVHLERFGSVNTWVNELRQLWIHGGSLWVETTDTNIIGGYFWGPNVDFTIKAGANSQKYTNCHIVPSPVNGGIYVPTLVTHLGITNCFFDGNAALDTGHCINGRMRNSTIVGNTFWNAGMCGVRLIEGQANTINGNAFERLNRLAGSYSDILLRPAASAACSGNTITGNTHANNQTASNKAYCFEESNADQANGCKDNVYIGNSRDLAMATGYAGSISSASRADAAVYERSALAYNGGMNTYHEGTATVVDGQSTVVVTHNLGIAPLFAEIRCQPSNVATLGTRTISHGTYTTTQFTITLSSAASGSNINVQWKIRIGS